MALDLMPRNELGQAVSRKCPDPNCGGMLVYEPQAATWSYPARHYWRCDGLTHKRDDDVKERWRKDVRISVEAYLTAALSDQIAARPLSEWQEDMGNVLWWKFPVTEAPWCGTPNDLGQQVLIDTIIYAQRGGHTVRVEDGTLRADIGGWPGHHTHFTPLPTPSRRPRNRVTTLKCPL